MAPKLALLLGTVVLILTVGELTARVMADAKAGGSAGPAAAHPDLPVLRDILEIAKPNVDGIYQGVRHRTNSRGVRGPEYTPVPAPGTFRILIAGDSVTMGWGVEEPDTYPAVLERRLDRSAEPGRRYEVVNLGLAGVNAAFSARRLARYADFYQPDLLVYGFTLNDIEGPSYRELPREDRRAATRDAWRRALRFHDSPSVLLRELWPRWIMLLEWDVFHLPESEMAAEAAEWRDNYFDNPAAWDDFTAALDGIAILARARGICALVFLHTHLTALTPEHPFLPVYERVAEAARQRGLGVTPSFSRFVGRDPERLWVNAFDVHPNAEAHAILAEALEAGVRELPARCLGPHSGLEGSPDESAASGWPASASPDPGSSR